MTRSPALNLAADEPAPGDQPGPAVVQLSGSEVIDADVIGELVEVMGDDFVGLVKTYLDNAPDYLEKMRVAVAAGNVEAAVLPVHSLKSSSANVGAMQLYEYAKQIEHLARTGSLSEVEAGIEPLAEHLQRAARDLQRMIATDLIAES